MARMNWARNRSRQRIAKFGAEDARGAEAANIIALFPRNRLCAPKPSKPALRDEAAKAMKAFTGTITKEITCAHCGHSGVARVPLGHRGGLYCRECGCTV
jgi:hypothetical protein